MASQGSAVAAPRCGTAGADTTDSRAEAMELARAACSAACRVRPGSRPIASMYGGRRSGAGRGVDVNTQAAHRPLPGVADFLTGGQVTMNLSWSQRRSSRAHGVPGLDRGGKRRSDGRGKVGRGLVHANPPGRRHLARRRRLFGPGSVTWRIMPRRSSGWPGCVPVPAGTTRAPCAPTCRTPDSLTAAKRGAVRADREFVRVRTYGSAPEAERAAAGFARSTPRSPGRTPT